MRPGLPGSGKEIDMFASPSCSRYQLKTTKPPLEIAVRARSGMDLPEFVRCKVEGEGLCDYEVAHLLNVDAASIGRLRKAYGIERANAFPRRFESTYGKGALETFKKIIEKPEKTLADVARHFGFSREYARQVFKKVYNVPYTQMHGKKIIKRKRLRFQTRMKSKRVGSLMKVIAKLRSLGFEPCVVNQGSAFAIAINGLKLGFRSTSCCSQVGSKRYFRISRGRGPSPDHDFYICLCGTNGESVHYVIPSMMMPRSGVYLIPQASPEESKYARFKEAWNLLGHEGPVKRGACLNP
jgi:AraC-like DNA-binding protein